jgi:AcrR family transcriptional regulator
VARNKQAEKKILKTLSRENGDFEAISRAMLKGVPPDRPRDELLEYLAQWFLAIRHSQKSAVPPLDLPLSRLMAVFRKVVQEKGIEAEEFYEVLLERMFAETEGCDSSHGQGKVAARSRILDAAFEVFTEKGFHVATVDEIAERAGVGKGTLYRYFSNKEALFNELVRLRLEELEERAQAVLDGNDDVLEMIVKYLRTYFEFFDRNKRLYRLIVQERLDVDHQVEDLYVKKIMRRLPHLKLKIYEATQGGILKDIDFQTVFFGTMGFIHGVIQKWLAHDCSYSLTEELPTVVQVLFHGFCRKDGQPTDKLTD